MPFTGFGNAAWFFEFLPAMLKSLFSRHVLCVSLILTEISSDPTGKVHCSLFVNPFLGGPMLNGSGFYLIINLCQFVCFFL